MSASLEMSIAHWATAEGVTERSLAFVTRSIIGDVDKAPEMAEALKALRAREGNRPDFQALVDAVWDRLPDAIKKAREDCTSPLDKALAIVLA